MLVVDARDRRDRHVRPKGFPAEWDVPQGGEEVDGVEGMMRVVRDQAGKGADWIKLYGDYRAGPHGQTTPTFTLAEMNAAVETAHSLGRPVAVHSRTTEGMRRAIMAGVDTIEHGDGGTPEVFKLMVEHGIALCPTLAAGRRDKPVRRLEQGRRRAGARRHHAQARECSRSRSPRA